SRCTSGADQASHFRFHHRNDRLLLWHEYARRNPGRGPFHHSGRRRLLSAYHCHRLRHQPLHDRHVRPLVFSWSQPPKPKGQSPVSTPTSRLSFLKMSPSVSRGSRSSKISPSASAPATPASCWAHRAAERACCS